MGFPVSIQPTAPFGVKATVAFEGGGPVKQMFNGGDPSEGDEDYSEERAASLDSFTNQDSGLDFDDYTRNQDYYDYTMARGATPTNPYPESIFSKIFGAQNVDYTNILNSPGGYTPDMVNQLRYDQNLNPQNFKPGDFYEGQQTSLGTVERMPATGIQQLVGAIPYLGGITRILHEIPYLQMIQE